MRRRTSLLVGGAIAAALALGGLVGGVVAESRSLASAPAAPVALADRALAGAAGGISTSAVSSLEAEVRARPRDPALLTQLGFAYQLRWRETADPAYLPRSEAALRRAERFGVEDSGAVLGLGSLALIRHQFAEALRTGIARSACCRARRGPTASSVTPSSSSVGTTRRSPPSSAWSRCARASRPTRASRMRASSWATARARSARWSSRSARLRDSPSRRRGRTSSSQSSSSASGDRPLRRRHVRAALAALPGYPSARIELARIDAAEGRLAAATREARRAVDAIPTPQAVGLLAETARAHGPAGRGTPSARHRRSDRPAARGQRRPGGRRSVRLPRRQSRLPSRTVELARRARAARPSIYGDDALAWALARAGRCDGGAAARNPGASPRDAGSAVVLPSRLRGGLRRESRRHARVVREGARPEPCVLGSLGTRRAGSSRTFLADLRRIIRP